MNLWAVVDKVSDNIIMIDSTRRDAYESKRMLQELYGEKYVVRKVQ